MALITDSAGATGVGPSCNICGGTELVSPNGSSNISCTACGAMPRTRLLWLFLVRHGLLRPGLRVLHIAPEPALSGRFATLWGEGYEPVDIDPAAYPHVERIRRLDLAEAAALPALHYDLVIHSHVMEHVSCNVTAVLFHLHRSLKADGHQVCCIPIMRDRHSAEDLAPLTRDEATRRFGQFDHVRQFGGEDVRRTLGMIFALPEHYDLLDSFDPAVLRRHGIPRIAWQGWSPNSVLVLAKRDLLLTLQPPAMDLAPPAT